LTKDPPSAAEKKLGLTDYRPAHLCTPFPVRSPTQQRHEEETSFSDEEKDFFLFRELRKEAPQGKKRHFG
jgi:hypothetical protein